jgi:hypothetical protein
MRFPQAKIAARSHRAPRRGRRSRSPEADAYVRTEVFLSRGVGKALAALALILLAGFAGDDAGGCLRGSAAGVVSLDVQCPDKGHDVGQARG